MGFGQVLGGISMGGGGDGDNGTSDYLLKLSSSPFERRPIQKLLPPSLRLKQTGGILQSGIQGIGNLIKNPGGLSPSVSGALNARLASESQNIAQNFRGIASQQAGASARGNVPVSIRAALESALNVAQERAQRGARQDALSESEGLRRQDLGQTFNIMDAILQFVSSGRGQAVSGLGAAGQLSLGQQTINNQSQAARTSAIGSLFSSFASK